MDDRLWIQEQGDVWHVARGTDHAFQAAKTMDQVERERIRALPTPGEAKRTGRALRLRHDREGVAGPGGGWVGENWLGRLLEHVRAALAGGRS